MPPTALARLMVSRSSGGGNAHAPASARVKLVIVGGAAGRRGRKGAAVVARRRRRAATAPSALVQLQTASSLASVDALLDAMIAEDNDDDGVKGAAAAPLPEWLLEDGEEEDGEAGGSSGKAKGEAEAAADETTFGSSSGGKKEDRRWDQAAADATGRRVLDREALRRELASFALADLSEEEDDEEEERGPATSAAASTPTKTPGTPDATAFIRVKNLASALFGGNNNTTNTANTPSPAPAAAPAPKRIDETAGAAFFGGEAALAKAALEGGELATATADELRAARERNQFGAGDAGLIPEDVFASIYSTRVASATRLKWEKEAERLEREILAANGGRE